MSSRKRGASKGKGKKSKGSGKNKNLGQKLTSGATTAEDNSTLAGIDSAYGITLDDLRLKADTLLLDLREDLKESPVLAFTEEIEADLRALYSAATDSSQHSVDASEEMLDFSFKSQLDLTAFVDKVSNFITKTPDVDPKKYYRPLLQLYEAAYRSGLQRMNLTTKRAELIGAKERPHLHAALMDELAFLKVSNATLFEKFTTQRLVWLMQSGRWSDLPARSIMENNRALKRSNFKEPHFGALTAAVKKGDYPNCLQLLESGEGFVNEQDGKSGATPIHHATWDGRLDIVKLLLEYDAEVDHQTRRGYTALHFAYENHHEELIEFLIKKGANEKKKSLLGQIPLDMIKLRDAKQLRRRKQKLQAAMDAAMAEQKGAMSGESNKSAKKKGKGKKRKGK